MSMKSANLVHLDALWREYVNADPDLRRMEQEKRDIAHRRAWEADARRKRAERSRARREKAKWLAGMVLTALLFDALVLIICLS